LEENTDSVLAQGERLVIRALGHETHSKAHFLPVPPQGSLDGRKFTLLTSAHIDREGYSNQLEVLFCSVYPLHAGHYASLFTMNLDLSGEGHGSGSTRLACKNGAVDSITLPASTVHSKYAFDKSRPFSYIQYDLETVAEHQFVAIVNKADAPSDDFLIAEFSANSEAQIIFDTNIKQFLWSPLHWKLQTDRPLVMNMKVPALDSSLLAYHLTISSKDCGSDTLFRPLVRQYISDVYESKFFVNVAEADINIHGVAPYMPPSMRSKDTQHGIAFQVWSDPTCAAPLHVALSVDIPGSFGKLWMRYRTLFATFPLVIVALVLAKQFKVYDDTGFFISFTEGLNLCLRRDVPLLISGLVFVLMIVSNSSKAVSSTPTTSQWFDRHHSNATESMSDYTMNNLLTGSPDPFFWFLLPVFGVICTGLTIAINYLLLFVTYIFTLILSQVYRAPKSDEARFALLFTCSQTFTNILIDGK
jgi:glycosylphosphatidylinositol deacylase